MAPAMHDWSSWLPCRRTPSTRVRQTCDKGMCWLGGEPSLTETRGGCRQAPPTQCDQSGQDMPCSPAGMWYTCALQPSCEITCQTWALFGRILQITPWLISAAPFSMHDAYLMQLHVRLTSMKLRVSNSIPATLLERSHGRIIEASSHRVLQIIEDDGASDLLDAELTNLERIENINQNGRCL